MASDLCDRLKSLLHQMRCAPPGDGNDIGLVATIHALATSCGGDVERLSQQIVLEYARKTRPLETQDGE